MKSLISAASLEIADLAEIVTLAAKYRKCSPPKIPHVNACFIFAEPSTRTKTSFIYAAQGLNMPICDLLLPLSRTVSGADLLDELNVIARFGDTVFIARGEEAVNCLSHGNLIGINCGDSSEHPSQALIDLFAIIESMNCKSLDCLREVRIAFLSPRGALTRAITSFAIVCRTLGLATTLFTNDENYANADCKADEVVHIDLLDVHRITTLLEPYNFIYVIPAYRNGIMSPEESFPLSPSIVGQKKILHPFPRTPVELPRSFDDTKSNLYFLQQRVSVPIRQSLLSWCCAR
jgi:aspartate carbamoyltransferase catalytic subunit